MRTSKKSPHLAGSVRSNHTISTGALTTVLGQLACVSGGFNWKSCNLDEDTVQCSLLGLADRFPFHLPSGTACSLMTNVTDVTRRCFDRSSDSISMFRSVFLVISEIAVSNALYRRFAQTRITAKAEEASDRAVSHAMAVMTASRFAIATRSKRPRKEATYSASGQSASLRRQ